MGWARANFRSHLSYQAGLNKLCVDIIILWSRLNLEDNLDEGAWEVLDENDLRK
jgi:hypothetical protein